MKKYLICIFILFLGCNTATSLVDSDSDHDMYEADLYEEEDFNDSDLDADTVNDEDMKEYDIVTLSEWEKIASSSAVPFYSNSSFAKLNDRYYKTLLDDVYSSQDGIKWEQINPNAPFLARTGHTVSNFKENLIVVGGSSLKDNMDLWYSEDGDYWYPACIECPFDSIWRPGAIEFKDRFWIIGGKPNDWENPGGVWSSNDLKSWRNDVTESPFGRIYESDITIFNDQLWVFVINYDRTANSLWRSSDGVNWENVSQTFPFEVRRRVGFYSWKGKLKIAGGYYYDEEKNESEYFNDIWSSDDGINWEKTGDFGDFGARNSSTVITKNDEVVFINGSAGTFAGKREIIASKDEKEWTLKYRSSVFSGRYAHSVIRFKDKFWVIGGKDRSDNDEVDKEVYSSENGVDWELVSSDSVFGNKFDHKTVVFKDQLWMIGGRFFDSTSGYGDVWKTENGKDWELVVERAPFDGSDVRAAYIYNDEMVIVAKELDSSFVSFWYSDDGKNWRRGSKTEFMTCRNNPMVVHEGEVYMVGGCNDEYKGNLVYKRVESGGWKKLDTEAIFSPRSNHGLVSMGGYIWVVGGNDGWDLNDVWYSKDGVMWHQAQDAPFEPRGYFKLLAYDSKIWGFGGLESGRLGRTFGDVWVTEIESVETVKEEKKESSEQLFEEVEWNSTEGDIIVGRYDHTFFKTEYGYYAIGGAQHNETIDIANSVVFSTDAKTWQSYATDHLILNKHGIKFVYFKDKWWGIAGEHELSYYNRDIVGDIIYSLNGKVWVKVKEETELTPRYHHQAVVFKDKIWVVGGFDFDGNGMNDVWNSEDGTTWKKVLNHAPFQGRGRHKLHVFNDRIFMVGGQTYKYDDGGSEVWSTEDGVNWQMESYLGFSQRELPASTVAAGALWVFGGLDNEGYLNDLYYSEDGKTWTKAECSYPVHERKGAELLGDGDRLWLSGGVQGTTNYNDVWYADLKRKDP